MSGSIEYDLWVTDGDNEIMLTSLPAYTDDSVLQVAALGSSFIFSGSDEANGEELWITDATGTTGTTILKDINPGVSGSRPSLFVPGEAGTLYFTAHTDATGVELWKTDGTPAGTTMVADLNPGPASSMTVYDDYEEDLNWMLYRENQLLFMADNGSKGHELWLIPAPGQQPELVEIEPGPAGSTPSNFHLLDDTAVFSAWTSNTGLDLWAMPLGHAASVGDWNLY